MTAEEIEQIVLAYIKKELPLETIISVEENCGTLWVETIDGGTWTLDIMPCEEVDLDDFLGSEE